MFCGNLFLEISYGRQCTSKMRDIELNHVYFQSILSAIEDLCFNQDQFPKSLHTGKLHQKALLSLGVAVHKLSQAGEVKKTAEIIEKVHILIGMHGIIK